MVVDKPIAMHHQPTFDTLLARALDTLAAGGMPALRLSTLLVLGLLGIACLLLPVFVHPPADRRPAAVRARRPRNGHGTPPEDSTFAHGQSGLRRGERDWLDSLQTPDEFSALATLPPRRRADGPVPHWPLPTRPAPF